MSITYFRPRDRFGFSKDTLDIGNPISWKRAHFKKHLFKRVFAINDTCIDKFYQRHLSYYLAMHPEGNEEIFFKYLWELIESQLKVLMGKDVYDINHLNNERQIKRLKKFTEAVVANQELEIYALKQEVNRLKSLEKDGYINISQHRNQLRFAYIEIIQKFTLVYFFGMRNLYIYI